MAELESMMDEEKLNVIPVPESRLTSEVLDNEIQLTVFLTSRADRLNRKGGGVIMYTKITLTIKIAETVAHVSETCELVRCKLKCRRQAVAHRSPECAADDFLLSKLKSLCNKNKRLVVGDFNGPYINWVNLEVWSSTTSVDCKLLETSIGPALSNKLETPQDMTSTFSLHTR
ncbi:unnamed protein product [Schistosoma mattheei]|uniref:Uncharacterized protein n=1 Tax=Schistosoma mattheei TaxID=31246 RepID=A0A183PER7_9TREM|nr:unnamed protein product [Schistosoma mattheei]